MTKIIKTASGVSYRVVQRASDDGMHTYEEIEPVTDLKTKAGLTASSKVPEEIMALAEAAVDKLSSEFPGHLQAELARLRAIEAAMNVKGAEQERREEADAIFHAAHELKGQGGSFGFPLISKVAESLCRLIKQVPALDEQITAAIGIHLDALSLIINERMRVPGHPDDKRLISEIETLTLHLVGPPTDE